MSHPFLEMWYLLQYWISRTDRLQSRDLPENGPSSQKSWGPEHTAILGKLWKCTGIWSELGFSWPIFDANQWPIPQAILPAFIVVAGSRSSPLKRSVFPWVAWHGTRADTCYTFIHIYQIWAATRGFYLDETPKLARQHLILYWSVFSSVIHPVTEECLLNFCFNKNLNNNISLPLLNRNKA